MCFHSRFFYDPLCFAFYPFYCRSVQCNVSFTGRRSSGLDSCPLLMCFFNLTPHNLVYSTLLTQRPCKTLYISPTGRRSFGKQRFCPLLVCFFDLHHLVCSTLLTHRPFKILYVSPTGRRSSGLQRFCPLLMSCYS